MLERIICLFIGYVCGLFQTGYIYGHLNHIDIRKHGSGNAGTTNALRTLGKKAAAITVLGDFIKPMVASLIALLVFKGGTENVVVLSVYAGVGAVLGHIFPCYLKFSGGKGIATIAGFSTWFCFANGCWFVIPISMAVFVLLVIVSQYVSLGSIVAVLLCYTLIIVSGQLGYIDVEKEFLPEIYIVIGIYSAIAIIKHRTNIIRLFKGEENKLFEKKKKEK